MGSANAQGKLPALANVARVPLALNRRRLGRAHAQGHAHAVLLGRYYVMGKGVSAVEYRRGWRVRGRGHIGVHMGKGNKTVAETKVCTQPEQVIATRPKMPTQP